MKIYVASSWRNERWQPRIVQLLGEIMGHDVYDFKHPSADNVGFGWSELSNGHPDSPEKLRLAYDDPAAIRGFDFDINALKACDLCVLVLPAGMSANFEFGYAVGAGKRALVYAPPVAYAQACNENGYSTATWEPELMWKASDGIVVSEDELIQRVISLERAAA